jgi:hypothetical protein
VRLITQVFSKENIRRLFHDEIIPDGFDSSDAVRDLTGPIGGLMRINETAQLSDALIELLDGHLVLYALHAVYIFDVLGGQVLLRCGFGFAA